MRDRALSSIGVVAVGLATIAFGGPIFALLMVAIGVIGAIEVSRMIRAAAGPPLQLWLPLIVIVGFGALGVWGVAAPLIIALTFVTCLISLVAALSQPESSAALLSAALSITAALYLALPVYAAISLRALPGALDQAWLESVAANAAIAWPASPRGMAWVLLAVVIVWVGDSAAFLGGRAIGQRRLVPRISPNKTLEGAACGLLGAVLTAVLANATFGLGLPLLLGAGVGLIVAVVSQVGDLIESLVKRQLGTKDSGSLIPGHGGILDRTDSLLASVPVMWLLAMLIDGTGS